MNSNIIKVDISGQPCEAFQSIVIMQRQITPFCAHSHSASPLRHGWCRQHALKHKVPQAAGGVDLRKPAGQ